MIAAQSIGEPGTQLTMRTFHIGGVGQIRTEQSLARGAQRGHRQAQQRPAGQEEGPLGRHEPPGRARPRRRDRSRARALRPAVRRAPAWSRTAQRVKAGQLLAEWDPFAMPIVTEVAGYVKYGDIVDGVTMQESLDEVTGLSRKTIIESQGRGQPSAHHAQGRRRQHRQARRHRRPARRATSCPVGSNIFVNDGDYIEAGDVIAKISRETTKTKDITGGLPRVAELFEARKPKDHAVICEIDGIVHFGKDTKGKRKVLVVPEVGDPSEYLIPKGKHLSVREGDRVRAGEALMDGPANPHDILKVLGERALAKYLVDEIQEVYRLQGVRINDKHIEVIVRQMLRRVTRHRSGRHELPGRRARREAHLRGRERARDRRRRPAGQGRCAAARHHEGVAVDRVVHLGVVVPGDHQGAHRGVDQRTRRLPPRPQGERHHGSPDPGRHRPRARTSASRSMSLPRTRTAT